MEKSINYQNRSSFVKFCLLLIFSFAILKPAKGSSLNSPNIVSKNPSNIQKDEFIESSKSFNSNKKQQEREQLYEAYNLLHTLAQVITDN